MKRREKIFWLVLGAAYVVGLIALIPAHGEICKEGTKAGEEACTSYRLVPFLIIEIGKILDALGVAITALATIAIAWFTWSLRRSTDKLWDAGERQIALVRQVSTAQSRDMEASIQASSRAADAAISSNEIAISTAERQLRAYILVEGSVVTNIVEGELSGNGVPIALVTLKNFGLTPAHEVRSVSGFAFDNYPIPDQKITVSDADFERANSVSPLAPNQIHTSRMIYAKGILEDSTKAAIRDGNAVIYLYGEVRYVDAFGHRRVTKYRHMMGGPVGVTPGGSLVACEKGNEFT